VAGSCEYGDEPSGSGATALVTCTVSSDCIASDDGMNNELEEIWKEAVWLNFRHCPRLFLEELRKTTTT
jgi:hypothetical protein